MCTPKYHRSRCWEPEPIISCCWGGSRISDRPASGCSPCTRDEAGCPGILLGEAGGNTCEREMFPPQLQRRAKRFLMGLSGSVENPVHLGCLQADDWGCLCPGISPHPMAQNRLGFLSWLAFLACFFICSCGHAGPRAGENCAFCDPQRTSHSRWTYFPGSER